ncbi:ABATE domain-containing protein [Streptomyces sp. NPDC096153]|uniref:CGNR zinc finger domain-containing protein n=1 Tax=Streptomyces sp. NPDC096153 TaxID=3155548 RepID=UPI00332FC8C8
MTGWDEGARPLIGGHPAVDLVNTVSWRLDPARRVDHLDDAQALVSWAQAAGLVDPGAAEALRAPAEDDPPGAESVLRRLRRVREVVHALLDAAVHGRPPAEADLRAFHRLSLDAARRTPYVLSLPLSRRRAPSTFGELLDQLTLAAEELLADDEVLGVRLCQGPGCGWLFLDRSRSHSRRWCSSGDCGNRDRARRHYARTRRAAGAADGQAVGAFPARSGEAAAGVSPRRARR